MKREEFQATAHQKIDEIIAKINELEAKKESVHENVKEQYDETIQDLKAKKTALQAKYDEIVDATDERFEEIKEAFASAAESFKEGFSKIASLF